MRLRHCAGDNFEPIVGRGCRLRYSRFLRKQNDKNLRYGLPMFDSVVGNMRQDKMKGDGHET
jgi:hypothetical protein